MPLKQLGICRVLLGGEDDSLLLVEGGAIVWKREEGLASVASTLFLDLPTAAADVEASYRAARPSLTDRVNAEVLSVKVCFHLWLAGVIRTARQQIRGSIWGLNRP